MKINQKMYSIISEIFQCPRIQNMASLNGKEELSAYLSSSPPPFCPKGRVTDKDAIVQIIDSAKR